MSAILQVQNVTKRFGRDTAVNDITFDIHKGEVVGFVGLNGAGKSTTINMLLGFLRASEGEVRLFGEKVTTSNAWRSHGRIGFATGDMSLFESMTGKQYLRFVSKLYGRKLGGERYKHLCDLFDPQLNKKIGDLSRGNRQKIALIAAFMHSPELVILDEPSSGLDPLMQQRFLSLVREQAEKGVTIFMSSHYLNEVVDVCSRILLIKQGVLVKDMPTSELEVGTGRRVRVVAKVNPTLPRGAQEESRSKAGGLYTVEFIYNGTASQLQLWLSGVKAVEDFTVNEHDSTAMFDDLYREEVGNV